MYVNSSLVPASFHTISVIQSTPVWNVDDISAFLPIILWAGLRTVVFGSYILLQSHGVILVPTLVYT
jgi:hypothetical protein